MLPRPYPKSGRPKTNKSTSNFNTKAIYMSLKEKLQHFSDALTSATHAPDDYPSWGYVTYENNMANLKQLWSEIRPKLKSNVDKRDFIEEKLQEAFTAFDAGEKDKGLDAIMAIYNLNLKQPR